MLCSSVYWTPVPSPYRLGTYPAPRGQRLLFVRVSIVFLVLIVFADIIVLLYVVT